MRKQIAGRVFPLPDFLIIGQMRAATSTLYQYLQQHPKIFMPQIKELRFFNHDLHAVDRAAKVPKGLPVTLEDYSAHFEAALADQILGEASPQYIDSDYAAQQIRQLLPEVRLICNLRNPVDRLYSLYSLEVRGGRLQQSFRNWYAASRDSRAVQRIASHDSLKKFYELFPGDQIRIVLFEDIASSPIQTVTSLCEWLEVDADFKPDLDVGTNAGGIPKSRLLARLMHAIRSNRQLFPKMKVLLPHPVQKFIRRLNQANVEKAPGLDAQMRAELAERFADDTRRLQDLVRRDLSAWLLPTVPAARSNGPDRAG